MIWILLVVVATLTVACVYLLSERERDKDALERYRAVVTQWTLYMHEKQHGRDFALWRKEFGE